MSDIDERVQRLQDKDEIRELTARYCHAITDGDVETIVSLFTPDGVFAPGDRRILGEQALRDFYGELAARGLTKPFIQNHIIEVNGADATCRSAVHVRRLHNGEERSSD